MKLLRNLIGILFLAFGAIALFSISGSQAGPIPSDPSARLTWLETQAEAMEPKMTTALTATIVGSDMFRFKNHQIDPDLPRIILVYGASKEVFGKFAFDNHSRPWDVMRFANFELRKAQCAWFQRTALFQEDVVFVVAFQLDEDPLHYIPFNEDMCRLYV